MPEPTTQKDQLTAIFKLTGCKDFAEAQSQIESWKAAADPDAVSAMSQLQEIYGMFANVDDHKGAVAAIKGNQGDLKSVFGDLSVADKAGATKRIQELVGENAKLAPLQSLRAEIIKTLKLPEAAPDKDIINAISNFEARVHNEVITRAASAGITEPVKPPKKKGEENMMSRAEFNTLSNADRLAFSQKGGKLTDE